MNKEILDFNELYGILSKADPKDKILVFILYEIVIKICHREDNEYYYNTNDETDENNDEILKWVTCIHKMAPFSNFHNFKNGKRKIHTIIKHVCNNLRHIGIELDTKVCLITKEDHTRTTISKHIIKGLV